MCRPNRLSPCCKHETEILIYIHQGQAKRSRVAHAFCRCFVDGRAQQVVLSEIGRLDGDDAGTSSGGRLERRVESLSAQLCMWACAESCVHIPGPPRIPWWHLPGAYKSQASALGLMEGFMLQVVGLSSLQHCGDNRN